MGSEIAASAAKSGAQVINALKRAGVKTGAGFDYLMKTATRESSLNPNARAKTSSAAGLFQFIEQTWLGAVKRYGARHGLTSYAADITQTPDGRFAVRDKARREEILKLRYDANTSAALAGELANENRSFLEARLGRAASAADLYTAHFLGPAGAVKLLSAGANASAADLLPSAAAANVPVFFDGARKKSVGEVIASIAQSMRGETPVKEASAKSAPAMPKLHDMGERRAAEPKRDGVVHRMPAAVSASSPLPSPFSAIALSVLYALDPTRLTRRDEGQYEPRINSAAP